MYGRTQDTVPIPFSTEDRSADLTSWGGKVADEPSRASNRSSVSFIQGHLHFKRSSFFHNRASPFLFGTPAPKFFARWSNLELYISFFVVVRET